MAWLLAQETKSSAGIKARAMEACLNCKNGLGPDISYCSVCGQKTHDTKLTVVSLIKDFFGSLFNLDNGLYRSLAGLPIPGFLSKQFISGKRKSYLNPVRLFLITLIVHLTAITNLVPFESINRSLTEYHEQLGQSKIYQQFQDLDQQTPELMTGCDIDTVRSILFEGMRESQDSTNFNITGRSHRIATSDIFDMPVDEFIEVYKIETWWEKLLARQALRTARDPSGAIRFGVGNLIWSVFSTIIITGLFMKLLYIRRNRFFVEHLIVLFNIHSFAFLVVSIGFIISGLQNNTDMGSDGNFNLQLGGFGHLISLIFFFLSIKYYYQQGWFKSWIKFTIIGWTYLFTLISMIVLVTVISLFLFN